MLNFIKMDLYRMFRTKSMYVIWLVMAALILFTTFLSKSDYEQPNDTDSLQSGQITITTEDNINLGMSVEIPTEAGENITVYDVFFANSQGKFYALFLVIFAVMFSTADISSGYIKNIGGQVRSRGSLIFSRAAALAVFTVITLIGVLLLQAAANIICFGTLEWGNINELLPYFLTQLMLHYAMVMICMMIAIILRNNVISMIFAVCFTMNIMSVLYGLINIAAEKIGFKNFQVLQYTITGKLSMLPMAPSGNECLEALIIAFIFIMVTITASSIIFQKRDI